MKKFCKMMMMKYARRTVSALLALVLLFGMLPASVGEVFAASWMDEYIEKVVDWGVMRGDVLGNMNAEEKITRAEFVTMVNRAFGYTANTTHPFTDVRITDWYNNDIGIAYNMGYFKGTGETTADPNSYLTREQAVVLIGRNLLLEEKASETLGFSDSRSFNDWSRGMVESAISAGYVNGYEDGSFLPQKNVSRGEVAAMLVKAIGTMVHKPGTHSLGGVYGNVMISTSGATLKDTTIAGNLYITGGLELGDVLLDNVTVLGKIIVSGAGESHKGDSSIVLRNVESGELVIDSIANQFVTLRAEGDTQIDFTNVKTSAYLDDQTASGDGLLYVELNGESGMTVNMAGNIEEVVNRTPQSLLMIAEGTAKFVTIDENAIGSQLEVRNIASIEELNLDIGVPVTGEGDIAGVNINAAGAIVDILPDDINIRPGLEAQIAGEEMDTKDGNESSENPRILAGYPRVKNIAPTSADVVFQTNKKGTLYWALTNLIDGPVSAEDLIEEKDYKTKILMQGSLAVTASETDIRTKLTKLTEEGTYYVSAVLVDSRGQQSAVKYITFTTPDGTAPKFANGYPELTLVKMDYAQVSVMSTKSSVLYYAVLPKGAGAPTINEFKSGAISGDLGNCPVDGIPVNKNVIRILNVCEEGKLEEKVTYELYLCLIDPDNGKDSGVRKITFTTVDGTPPVLQDAVVTGIQKNSVNLTTSMNEPGTIYWVVVNAGQDYPVTPSGSTEKPALDSRVAILQVINGMGNVIKAGKSSAKENSDVVLKISGLEPESSYDVYYVAEDKAGNCSAVKMISVNTLDDVSPKVTQEFTKTVDEQGLRPLSETDIKLIFTENVRNKDAAYSFYEQYKVITDPKSTPQEVVAAQKTLVKELERSVQLWDVSNTNAEYQVKHDPGATKEDTGTWINYEKIKMEMTDEGLLVLTFKHGEAISLSSGSTYQFIVEDVTDNSNNKNPMKPNPYKLPKFTTVSAQVNLTSRASNSISVDGEPMQWKLGSATEDAADVDMRFWMSPQSTSSVNNNIYYDIWFEAEDINVEFELYCRVINPETKTAVSTGTEEDGLSMFAACNRVDQNGWNYLGKMEITASGTMARGSINALINESANITSGRISRLNTLDENLIYEFALDIVSIYGETDEESWSDDVKLRVRVPAGMDLSETDYGRSEKLEKFESDVEPIENPEEFFVSHKFIDKKTPRIVQASFNAGDGMVEMKMMLDRSGTIHYVIAPMYTKEGGYDPSILTRALDKDGNEVDFEELFKLGVCPPENSSSFTKDDPMGDCPKLAAPTDDRIAELVDKGTPDEGIKSGKERVGTTTKTIKVDKLAPLTTYFVYCILTGESQRYSEVYCFQFTTQPVTTPAIGLYVEHGDNVKVTTSTPAELDWAVYSSDFAHRIFGEQFKDCVKEELERDYINYCDIRSMAADKLTILTALQTSISSEDDRSMFDVYADEQTKQWVLEYIQGEASTNFTATETGSKSFPNAEKPEVIHPTLLSPETQYYFIAAARNPLGQSYGFKAVSNVHLADTEAPQLLSDEENITTLWRYASEVPENIEDYHYNISIDDPAEWVTPKAYAYKGTVTLQFSEVIYQLAKNQEDLNTDPVKITDDNFADLVKVVGGHLNIKNVDVSGQTITFDFEHAIVGSTITIFEDGSIADVYSNVNGQGARLVLRFEIPTEGMGYLTTFSEPRFKIIWIEGN